MNVFDRLVYEAVRQVPWGKVTTYGEIAKALGDIRAARAVGESLSKNPFPGDVPCHRVVMSDGSLGGYAFGGPQEKKRRLFEEGTTFRNGKVDLEKHLVRAEEIRVYPILKKMRNAQKKLAKLVVLEGEPEPELAAGVDVSYRGETAVAAAVVVNRRGEVVERNTWRGKAEFPYVPTYLAFREMRPVYMALQGVDFDVLLVDGQGALHPVGAGEACHFGVVLDVPAVGVAKSRLVGRVVGRRVYMGEKLRGYAVPVGKKIVYVSPGHLVSVDAALRVAKAFWWRGKQPLPLVLAHRLAVEVGRAYAKGSENEV